MCQSRGRRHIDIGSAALVVDIIFGVCHPHQRVISRNPDRLQTDGMADCLGHTLSAVGYPDNLHRGIRHDIKHAESGGLPRLGRTETSFERIYRNYNLLFHNNITHIHP